MRVAVFLSAGLGDALLLVPLVKELKKQEAKVSGIFTSPFHCEQLFYNTNIFDEILVSHETIASTVISSIKNFKKFDVAYLNFFASTRKNILLAKSIAKKIVTNQTTLNQIQKNSSVISGWKSGIHDATQNLRLLNPEADDSILNEENFRVDFPKTKLYEKKFPELNSLSGKKYFAVQICSGNNVQKFKNWRTEHWIEFLKNISGKFPERNFLLLGEPREKEIADIILKEKIKRIYSAVGKTEIMEAVEFIRNSEMFIGLDGGLMHIAVAVGKPTFTLWGASDFNMYGYEKINPERHKIVYNEISCRPCNSWLSPNTSRVNNPMDCPDYICMSNLKPGFVFTEFQKFYNKIST